MKVFEVRTSFETQSILADNAEALDIIASRAIGTPIGEAKFPGFYISNLKDPVANFFNMSYGFLLYDEVAKNAIGSIAEKAGEINEIEVEELGILYALNVLEHCENALDHSQSVWRQGHDGRKLGLKDYAFIAANVITSSGLFRIPEDRYSTTLAVTGSLKQEDDFYMAYHDAGLTGLDFELLWTDEE